MISDPEKRTIFMTASQATMLGYEVPKHAVNEKQPFGLQVQPEEIEGLLELAAEMIHEWSNNDYSDFPAGSARNAQLHLANAYLQLGHAFNGALHRIMEHEVSLGAEAFLRDAA